jgi:hypothetical protein
MNEGGTAVRQFKFFFVLLLVIAAGLITASSAMAAPHFVGDPVCTVTDPGGRTASISCSGKVAGFGAQDRIFVVITTAAGCSNPGNPDIPGQRNFVSGPLQPTSPGNIEFGPGTPNTVAGSVSCPGNQDAFISDQGTLTVYNCTSGSPRFDRKTGQQTNPNCTVEDTANI